MSDKEHIANGLVRCYCFFCGGAFFSQRASADYCCAAHKQKAYRWRIKITQLKQRAFKCVNEMSEYLKYDQTTPAANLALQEIRTLIAETQFNHNIRSVK